MNSSSSTYVLVFTIAICAVFGAGVAVVHNSTSAILEKNERLHRNRIVARAFGLEIAGKRAEDYERAVAQSIEINTIAAGARSFTVLRFRGAGRADIGFEFRGVGFWDAIRGIIVLSADLQRIINIQFFEQKETPGLGARIEETWFTDQFKGLEIAWDAPVGQRIIIGASSNPNARNRVDAITGASQTSLALMKMLNIELSTFRRALDGRE